MKQEIIREIISIVLILLISSTTVTQCYVLERSHDIEKKNGDYHLTRAILELVN